MIRAGELTTAPWETRRKFWLDELKLPLQWRNFGAEDLEAPEKFLKKTDFEGVLVPEELSDHLLSHSTQIPTEIVETGFVDSLIRERQKIWIRCFLKESLRKFILEKSTKLDTHAHCYVTGSGPWARFCASVAIQMGFENLIFISLQEEQAEAMLSQLNKVFFGLDLKILKETDLTLQPNNGSLLLNTLTLQNGGVVFEDLTYLNFVRKQGLVVDLPVVFGENVLLDEARHVGLTAISGLEIWGLRDFYFLKSLLGPELKISEQEYLSKWIPFAVSENETKV